MKSVAREIRTKHFLAAHISAPTLVLFRLCRMRLKQWSRLQLCRTCHSKQFEGLGNQDKSNQTTASGRMCQSASDTQDILYQALVVPDLHLASSKDPLFQTTSTTRSSQSDQDAIQSHLSHLPSSTHIQNALLQRRRAYLCALLHHRIRRALCRVWLEAVDCCRPACQ